MMEATNVDPLVFIDQWLDGYIENRAWVQKGPSTETESHALAWVENWFPLEDRPEVEHYEVVGIEYVRYSGIKLNLSRGRYVMEDPKTRCGLCNGYGIRSDMERCPECHGTGMAGRFYPDDGEGYPIEVCHASATGAIECWKVVVTCQL